MSVKSLIDQILPYTPGYTRTGVRGLLALIQKGQDLMYDYDADSQKWIGTDNKGWPTYLITQSNVFNYDAIAANTVAGAITITLNNTLYNVRIRRVLKVFVDATNVDYQKRWVGKPYVWSWSNPFSNEVTRRDVADIPIRSTLALENTPARFSFIDDPGATNNMFFFEFVWEPPRLTSEQVPLVVPAKWEDAIEDYVFGMIQKRQNGKMNDQLTKFETEWIPLFRSETGLGAQITPTETQVRLC